MSHRFRDMATYSLKLSTENCGQTAADGDMVAIDSPARCENPRNPSPSSAQKIILLDRFSTTTACTICNLQF